MVQELIVNVAECGVNIRNIRTRLKCVQKRVNVAGVRLLL